MFCPPRYLLPIAVLCLFSHMGAGADTDRLRAYYEKLLEAEPDNQRAREFLGLPEPDSPASEASAGEPAPARWLKLLEEEKVEDAFSAWREFWEGAAARDRPGIAAEAIESFPPDQLPSILEIVLPSFAPESRARQILLNACAIRFVESADAESILSGWVVLAEQGDAQFARAAALLAARIGRAREWAEMLQLEAQAGEPPEQLWEAWMAADKMERAAEVTADWFARAPNSHRALLAKLEILLLSGRDADATEALQQWLAGQPKEKLAAVQETLPEFAGRLGWRDGNEIALRMQLKVEPDDFDARLALLEHLLLWREAEEASELLSEPLAGPADGRQYAAFLEKTAALQMQFGMHAEAAQTARKALADASRNDDGEAQSRLLLLLVESLRLSGQTAGAVEVLARELAPGKSPLPPVELDKELFTLLSQPQSSLLAETNGKESNGPAVTSLDLQRVVPVRRGLTHRVRGFLDALQQNADAMANEEHLLRLARWQEWTEDSARAEATLRSALRQWPDSLRAREEALLLARKLRNRETELQMLRELAELELETSRREDWRRELAFLQLQSEDPEESNQGMLFLMEQVTEPDAPATAWRDLALAHELRDEWLAAWQCWGPAYRAASTDELRAEIRVGGERAAKRLGYLELWQEWTRVQSPEALTGASPAGRVQDGGGNTPDQPTKDLRTLRSRDPVAWLDSARWLEESGASPNVVTEFWREAAWRFPRNAAVLRAAAAGLRNESPGEAVSLLLQANDYSPPRPAEAFELARLLEETGDRTRAVDFYRKVLDLDPVPVDSQPSAVFPVSLSVSERRRLTSMIFRLRAASGTWSGGWAALMANPREAPASLRIRSLRALGKILSQSAVVDAADIPPVDSLSVAEAVEFAVAMGNIPEALQILRGHIAANPLDYPATLSFFRIAMDAGLWDDALAFVQENSGNTPERADFFLAALGERILAGETWQDLLENEEAAALPETLLWPVSQLLAETGNREQALNLATESIPDLPAEIQNTAMEQALAWSLRIGDLPAARKILASHPVPASNLLESDAALVRARFLLGTQSDRARWMDDYFNRPPNEQNLSVASSRFLLGALGGLDLVEEASRLNEEISNATFGEGDRRMFVATLRGIVERLLAWRLEEAASELIASALEGDEALRMLRGQMDEWQRGELQVLATAAALSQQPFSALPASIHSIRNLLGENREFLPAVAAVLAQSGDPARASLIFQILWESGDRRPVILSSWWPVVRSIDDAEHFKMLLEEFIRRGEKVEGVEHPHITLIDLALSQRDWDLAETALREALGRGITEPGLAERATALEFLKGNFSGLRDKHQPLWEKQGELLSGEILARSAWLAGDRDRFFVLLREIEPRDRAIFLRVWDAALAEPSLQPEDAVRLLSLLQELAPSDRERLFLAGVAAGEFAMAGDLVGVDGWFPTPETLNEIAGNPEAARALGPVILAAWGDFLESNHAAKTTPSYWQSVDAMVAAAELDASWQENLEGLWQEGQGNLFAGEIFLRSLARSAPKESLRAALARFLETRKTGKFWAGLAAMLDAAGHPDLALDVIDAWHGAGIPDEETFSAALLRASSLHRAGKANDALQVLDPWEEVAVLETGYLLPLANWMFEFQHYTESLRLHEEGMRTGPRNLRKAHAHGAARAAQALDDHFTDGELQREEASIPGTSGMDFPR